MAFALDGKSFARRRSCERSAGFRSWALASMMSLLVVSLVVSSSARATAAAASVPKLVMLIAGQSYDTERTLPEFAGRFLSASFRVVTVGGAMTNPAHRFDQLAELADADVLLVSVWRRAPPVDQMTRIRDYVESGRPVVGIGTTSHAFTLRPGTSPAPGSAMWPEWENHVIGSRYNGHHPIRFVTTVTAMDSKHALLTGVALPFVSKMELNKVSPLHPRAHPILLGRIENGASEPVAWTFERDGRGRTFFTPLGHPEDFENPSFQRLLVNGIRWAARLPLAPGDKILEGGKRP